jgi:hypothetical protein
MRGKIALEEYFAQNNFWLTTSGNFRTQTLIDAMLEIGANRILFSTDWPFENIDHPADWFDVATISESERLKDRAHKRCKAIQVRALTPALLGVWSARTFARALASLAGLNFFCSAASRFA